MLRPTLFATLALSLGLTACGGGSADPRDLLSAGNQALGRGDFEAAQDDLQAAADAVDASSPLYNDIQKGLLRAKAGAAPKEALADLEAKADAMGDVLDVELYSTVAVDMCQAGHFDEAVEVVKLADARFGKTPLMESQVANIQKLMQSAGANDALSALAGLGYGGGE